MCVISVCMQFYLCFIYAFVYAFVNIIARYFKYKIYQQQTSLQFYYLRKIFRISSNEDDFNIFQFNGVLMGRIFYFDDE